ncbi:MAG: alpha/beta hydrolase [Ilumatobacteraceae bacterium]|nr:alpha/beta hydrolase [Ilumatobacteraceae bacterium]
MASLPARLQRPVVRLIGRRLAAATTAERMRRVIGRANALLAPCLGVTTAPVELGGRDGLRLTPSGSATPERAVLMFHGGGYVFGSPRMYRPLAGRVAKAASAAVYLPSYRLAPEHPHPAAVDDGLAAYRALIEQVPVERLAVGGDSAGGGLSVAVLQAARRAGLPMPACLVLLSPWLDLTGDGESHTANADSEILILPASVERATRFYRGDVAADDPAVSPLFGDLTGLPPTLVQVSRNELLFSDSDTFADRAGAAGVDVDLRVADDLWHVWHLMAPVVPEARASIAEIGEFVRRHAAER